MPYTISLATDATRTLVADALDAAGDQRTRVALKAARQVAEDKARSKDVRSQAVKVTALLAEADELKTIAAELRAATEVAVLAVDQRGRITATGGGAGSLPARPEGGGGGSGVDALGRDGAVTLTEEAVAQLEASTTPRVAALADLIVSVKGAENTPPGDVDNPPAVVDDGTSPEAQHLADLAGLTPANPDAVEDPLTGALPEDEPTGADLERDLDL